MAQTAPPNAPPKVSQDVDVGHDEVERRFTDEERNGAAAAKLVAGIAAFETYIRNNQESIPNYGERYRRGETISAAFVGSKINQVVSRRFVKKQQMHWTLYGARLHLQTRIKILNTELEDEFRRWYPLLRVQAKAA